MTVLVGSQSVEEQLEYFYAQYARRVAPLYARQGDDNSHEKHEKAQKGREE